MQYNNVMSPRFAVHFTSHSLACISPLAFLSVQLALPSQLLLLPHHFASVSFTVPLSCSGALFSVVRAPLALISTSALFPAMSITKSEHVEVYRIVLYSPAYFTACALGGALSCGLTHTLMTPIDLVKCNKQANPLLFSHSAAAALRDMYTGKLAPVGFSEGIRGVFRGWSATLAGYSVQGAFKFGLYEWLKHRLMVRLGEDAPRHSDAVHVGSSAAAELVADVGLCPFEAVKVRVQTNPSFARGLLDGVPRMLRKEGVGSLYAGLVPLWARQVPYTVIKFLSFERIATALFSYSPITKEGMTRPQQLTVVFTAGYLAGVLCGLVSHPADVLVSHLYQSTTAVSDNRGLLARCRDIVYGRGGVGGIGMRGLWAGLGPRLFMVGSLTGLQWLIYGSFKAAIGLPTPGDVIVVVKTVKEER